MGKGNNKYLLMIYSSCLKKLSIYMACSFSIGLESSSNFVDEPVKEKYSVNMHYNNLGKRGKIGMKQRRLSYYMVGFNKKGLCYSIQLPHK